MMVKSISKKGELVKELKSNDCELCPAITTEITASAFAGIGKPLNDVACVESILNFASRRAPHTGIIADIIIKSKVFMPLESSIIGVLIERELLRR